MHELILHREDGDKQQFSIKASALIGRHSACDVRIQDPMASRRHAELDYEKGAAYHRPWLGKSAPGQWQPARADSATMISSPSATSVCGWILKPQSRSCSASKTTTKATEVDTSTRDADHLEVDDQPTLDAKGDQSTVPYLFYGGDEILITKPILCTANVIRKSVNNAPRDGISRWV